MRSAIVLLLLFSTTISAEPWGKDADMVPTCKQARTCKSRCRTPLLGSFAEAAIKFHQCVISPADGPRSHFYPSSSQYTLDAMRKYGFFRGFMLGCDRLMRENPEKWVYRKYYLPGTGIIKYDPVK
ncbi:MAG: membrane protein insertion efficiency factor YidD [Chlamydiales bacterium]|nr:membrane protein insertion efficiency factor YidD [Chlamydiia bacterium]MCP5507021.1 membrane protein insertion efficiency factor YidD [Chlamydiales bacterium]